MVTPFKVRYVSILSVIHPLTIQCSSIFPCFPHGHNGALSTVEYRGHREPVRQRCALRHSLLYLQRQWQPTRGKGGWAQRAQRAQTTRQTGGATIIRPLFIRYQCVIRSLFGHQMRDEASPHCYNVIHFVRFDIRTSTDQIISSREHSGINSSDM